MLNIGLLGSSTMVSSPHKTSKQKPEGGEYVLYKIPVKILMLRLSDTFHIISISLFCSLVDLSWWSMRPKNKYSKPIWANMEACSREWPNGSTCHTALGIEQLPNVSFRNLIPRVIWSIMSTYEAAASSFIHQPAPTNSSWPLNESNYFI